MSHNSVCSGDGIDDLLVAEPHHYSLFYGPDVGALFGWTGGPDFPKGTVSVRWNDTSPL